MTTFLPYSLPIFQQAMSSDKQVIALSMIIIALLFTLLVEKEFVRAYGTENIRLWLGTINIFSWTLLGVFAFLMLMRFLGFIFDWAS
jgi:hypothetical protein